MDSRLLIPRTEKSHISVSKEVSIDYTYSLSPHVKKKVHGETDRGFLRERELLGTAT